MSKGLLEVGMAYAGQHRRIAVYFCNCMRMDENTFQLGKEMTKRNMITVYKSENSTDSRYGTIVHYFSYQKT